MIYWLWMAFWKVKFSLTASFHIYIYANFLFVYVQKGEIVTCFANAIHFLAFLYSFSSENFHFLHISSTIYVIFDLPCQKGKMPLNLFYGPSLNRWNFSFWQASKFSQSDLWVMDGWSMILILVYQKCQNILTRLLSYLCKSFCLYS